MGVIFCTGDMKVTSKPVSSSHLQDKHTGQLGLESQLLPARSDPSSGRLLLHLSLSIFHKLYSSASAPSCITRPVTLQGDQYNYFSPLKYLEITHLVFRQPLKPKTEGNGASALTPSCSLPRQERPPNQTVLLLQNQGLAISKSLFQQRCLAAWRRERAGQGEALTITDGRIGQAGT